MEEIIFKNATEEDSPILIKLAINIIQKKYGLFLEKDLIAKYLESGQCDKEIIENINNCIIMEIENKYIGFSIILENKIHLMMISPEYEKQGNGTKLLKFIENKLFKYFNQIELQSFVGNNIANTFYEKNEWIKVEKINNNGIEVYKYIKIKQ